MPFVGERAGARTIFCGVSLPSQTPESLATKLASVIACNIRRRCDLALNATGNAYRTAVPNQCTTLRTRGSTDVLFARF